MRNIVLGVMLLGLAACSKAPTADIADANVATVKGIYAAFATGDIPAVVEPLAADAVWNEADSSPYADKNPYIGADEIISGLFARVGGEWTDFAAIPSQFVADENRVAVMGRYTGVYNETQKPLDAQFVHVWEFSNSKITSVQQYTDTAQYAAVTSGNDALAGNASEGDE